MIFAKRCLPGLLLAVVAMTARAEMSEINVAQQYGVAFLPLMGSAKSRSDGSRSRGRA